MSIDNRAYLKIGERILLSRNKAGNDQEVYQITGRVGEGGSAICYEAVRNRNGQGGQPDRGDRGGRAQKAAV